MRELDGVESIELPDTGGALDPTFSPDGRSIAFYAGENEVPSDRFQVWVGGL